MFDPAHIPKIRSLSRSTTSWRSAHASGKTGPYWRGHYRENGKRVTVHIGKKLPTELFTLLERAKFLPGADHRTWPSPGE